MKYIILLLVSSLFGCSASVQWQFGTQPTKQNVKQEKCPLQKSNYNLTPNRNPHRLFDTEE